MASECAATRAYSFRPSDRIGCMAAMRLLAGASGYSFKEWKGNFYPEKIKPEEMLAFYAERLPTVEINNTFYRMEEIVAAADLIEDRGFTTYDDLMHGFGGGYFPPIVGSRSRPAGPLPKMTLEENMTVVVQPNVIARPKENEVAAGVQVGELIRVTRTGFERLHQAPRGFFRA